MAFTSTLVRKSVFGNMRIEIYSYVSTGVTTGGITTGLSNIEHTSWKPDTIRASATIDDSTTAGLVTLDSITSGDTGTIMVVGR